MINGAALNKAQDVTINTARTEVLAVDNVNVLEAQAEHTEIEKVRCW